MDEQSENDIEMSRSRSSAFYGIRDSNISVELLRKGKCMARSMTDLAFKGKIDSMRIAIISLMSIIKCSVFVAVIVIYYGKVVNTYSTNLWIIVPITSFIILKDLYPLVPKLSLISHSFVRKKDLQTWVVIAFVCTLFILYVVSSSILILSAVGFVSSITNSIVLSTVMNFDDHVISFLEIEITVPEEDRVSFVNRRAANKGRDLCLYTWMFIIYVAIVGTQMVITLLSLESLI